MTHFFQTSYQWSLIFNLIHFCVMQGKEQDPASVLTGLDASLVGDSIKSNGSKQYAVLYQISVFSVFLCLVYAYVKYHILMLE